MGVTPTGGFILIWVHPGVPCTLKEGSMGGGDKGGEDKMTPPTSTPKPEVGAVSPEAQAAGSRSLLLVVVGSILLAGFFIVQMTRGEAALAVTAAGAGDAEAAVEAAEAQTLSADAIGSGVGAARAAVEDGAIDVASVTEASGAGDVEQSTASDGNAPGEGRSDADVLADSVSAGGTAGAGVTSPAAMGDGIVELDAAGTTPEKTDLNGGLPSADAIQPVDPTATNMQERASAAAIGGDAFAFGAVRAVGAGGASPAATTEEAFEREARIVADPSTAFDAESVEIDRETAWRERFHDDYWRKVVGILAADDAKWKAAADRAFSLRGEIVAAYLTQRNSDSARDVIVVGLGAASLAGLVWAVYSFGWKDGGMEMNSVVSLSGGGSLGGGDLVLPTKVQDVLAAAKASATGRQSALRAATAVQGKDLSKLSTEELKAQLARLRARKE